jgi:hypothetical protein
MATFFVGQRVRLINPKDPRNMGLEGRIADFHFVPAGTQVIGGFVDIDCDCIVNWVDGDTTVCDTASLEPILPDGMQPVSWSECLWQPEGVAA